MPTTFLFRQKNQKPTRRCYVFLGGLCLLIFVSCQQKTFPAKAPEGYDLVWADEFTKAGKPDSANWNYENGFVRNNEAQWYQPENAKCANGFLVIEATRSEKPNPNFREGSNDWRKKRRNIDYQSSCLVTRGKHSWLYGRFEMRAKIDISQGLWPAWWTLGIEKDWPANGEIDIMEYYRHKLLANIAFLDNNGRTKWYANTFDTDSLGGKKWAGGFHVWRMDWTEAHIALYLDDFLLNKVSLDSLVNREGSDFHPFKQPHYMLVNLAIGGDNGGDPSRTTFPRKFIIDYIRVYQKKTSAL